jgi:hypothetical protein
MAQDQSHEDKKTFFSILEWDLVRSGMGIEISQ